MKTTATKIEARKAIESLRRGIPPDGFIRHFTVGRDKEIERLQKLLLKKDGTAFLLNANYGNGKSHLIRFIREEALSKNYAVSVVALDAKNGIRFNRMDQIFGAICRNIELPGCSEKGIRSFFELVTSKIKNEYEQSDFWATLTNERQWDYSKVLDSSAFFIALRAWFHGKESTRIIAEDWMLSSENYKSERKRLYEELIFKQRAHFRDPRSDKQFYADGIFLLNQQSYLQCWNALNDINTLLVECGLQGIIFLFDEFEDIVTNMKNIAHQESAFWNLFNFFSGKFRGKTFYAVTPDFSNKCQFRLIEKGRSDFDCEGFNKIPKFALPPLESNDLMELIRKITEMHGIANTYPSEMDENQIGELLSRVFKEKTPDLTRNVITKTIEFLDGEYEKYSNSQEKYEGGMNNART